MSRHGSTLCSPTEEKILCRSPFRSGLVSPIFAVPSKGKRKIHKKEKTAGCLLLVPSPGSPPPLESAALAYSYIQYRIHPR